MLLGKSGIDNIKKFYKGKRVFITGHTGFKGSWLCKILIMLGADVYGYALKPEQEENLFELIHLEEKMTSITGDIRDLQELQQALNKAQPEIVFHLAAQPIVRESYKHPVMTYETNVMGTVNLLEAIRHCESVKSVVNVTTDKVYENKEWCWGYREDDVLNGYDPYSNSKSCSELITDSYKKCFLADSVAISTARAGNVIGGGDFATDRIIPDCVRSALKKEKISVRNPFSIRPYQHVLEPLFAYLIIAMKQFENKEYAGNYNIGPDDRSCITTGELVELFCKQWGEKLIWEDTSEVSVHEAQFLKLDCSKVKSVMEIVPTWDVEKAIEKTIEWTKCYREKLDIDECMSMQINEFAEESNK